MEKKRLSQEGLKLIACASMLIDHTGAILVYRLFRAAADGGNAGDLLRLYEMMRLIGRLAFPIYCFLLAEGAHYTGSPGRYAMRLGAAAVLSELPFDLAFYGGITWQHQNVMVTLLLGFFALKAMKKCPHVILKILAAVPFALLAEWMQTDYGAEGVLVIALFGLTRELKHRTILQFFGLWCIFSPNHLMMVNWLGGISVTTQECALLALIPIALYSGKKQTTSKTVRLAFYLFYPVHLLILLIVKEAL